MVWVYNFVLYDILSYTLVCVWLLSCFMKTKELLHFTLEMLIIQITIYYSQTIWVTQTERNIVVTI